MATTQMNLLDYLRSRTQVDLDSFDIEAAKEIGACIDCTSNQAEYYTELAKPSRKKLLQESVELTAKIHEQFPEVSFEELAVEVGAVKLAVEIRPLVTGDMHVMANPCYSCNKQKIVDTGKRFHQLFTIVDPQFDRERLVIKVPATWEGLQACRELKNNGVRTLATTLFIMEQAVLAGEVGCVSISPFVHELKALFDDTYKDGKSLLDLCVQAQRWYEQHCIPTKVKACATLGLDELLQLAGVAALTIVPDDLRALQSTRRSQAEIVGMSMFSNKTIRTEKMTYSSYLDEEAKYRMDFDAAEDGRAQYKLAQAITIFCDYQTKTECLIRAATAENA
ncbi:MAG: hypothetical protein M1836_004123 [Candelina mexicana]|nr:MAG: hypothetical protein M1836_004123 [Candelina mexicana]